MDSPEIVELTGPLTEGGMGNGLVFDDPWAKVGENVERLAKRLGVEPTDGGLGDVMFNHHRPDGTRVSYSLFAMAHAFLDRIEASGEIPPALADNAKAPE